MNKYLMLGLAMLASSLSIVLMAGVLIMSR